MAFHHRLQGGGSDLAALLLRLWPFHEGVTQVSQSRGTLNVLFWIKATMRDRSDFVMWCINWLRPFSDHLTLGFITSSEIAYADWPESARHPQPWKRCC